MSNTLLHLSRPSHERKVVHQTNNFETAVVPAVPLATTDGQKLPRACVLRQPWRNPPRFYCRSFPSRLLVTMMIDPSLVAQLEIQGEASQLFLSTVNQREKREQGMKVNFKIASVFDQDTREIAVRSAWAVKDLAIPLKHDSVLKIMGQWLHPRQVPFLVVVRSKESTSLARMSRSSPSKSGEETQTNLSQ